MVTRSIPNDNAGSGRLVLLAGLGFLGMLALAVGYGIYQWYVVRVEVGPNKLLLVVNKTGTDTALAESQFADQTVLYPHLLMKLGRNPSDASGLKGVQFEVLKEGRHFISPIWYQRILVDTTVIPDGKFGVLVRKHGRALPPGKTVSTVTMAQEIADPGIEPERGPISGTLSPGRHPINPYAYDVLMFDKIVVQEGWIGVKTRLSGLPPTDPNSFVVNSGERGVQPDVLGPGTYFDLNPFETRVDLVDMRSQKYDMLGEESIEFPSNDGFTIRMEATVEWAVYADQAPNVTVKVGDLQDVVHKVIRPYAMSLARIQGSKMTARDFIGAREAFQRRLFEDLRTQSKRQGVLIKAVTVRDLKPPDRVREIIQEREFADQTMTKYENEIAEAKAKADLVEQQELADQQAMIGDARREVVTVTVKAEEEKTVAVTQANQRFGVAKLDLESSRKQAEALRARGEADAKVILYQYEAEAEPLRAAVMAFGDGQTYAQNQFYLKVAPAIQSILTNTEGSFAEIFRGFAGNTAAGGAAASASPVKTPVEQPVGRPLNPPAETAGAAPPKEDAAVALDSRDRDVGTADPVDARP